MKGLLQGLVWLMMFVFGAAGTIAPLWSGIADGDWGGIPLMVVGIPMFIVSFLLAKKWGLDWSALGERW
jgi:predicted MFS family arabinose efflux permease